jgi:predicted aldo/keto reductase-like oxidoreductase
MPSKKTLNRREFMTRTLVGAGAASLVSCTGKPESGGTKAAAAPAPTQAPTTAAANPLLTRKLGKTGLVVPVVNMGVMNADNPDLVRRAYELGMRHFDTAAGYWRGKNEEMVGTVLAGLDARPQAVIATKVNIPPAQRESLAPAALKEAFIRTFEGSLKRLKTDYVDILHIHDVSRVEDLGRPGFTEALAELKAQKKARFVGFSTHTNMAACLDEASKTGFYDVVLVAYNYAMQDDARLRGSLETAAAKGIGLIAMKTQCMQSWYKDGLPAGEQAFYGGSIVQTAVLKWALRNDFIACAVPGFTSFRELEEDAVAGRDLEYTDGEKKFLADRNIKWAMAHCVQCGECRPTCPAGVDTPTLMRVHIYLRYPNVFQARDTLASLPAGKGLDACASCAACVASCRGRVDIARRIDQLKVHLG